MRARHVGRHSRISASDRASRREEILRLAMAEIFDRGYEQTSMAQIARSTSASKETLYAWFGDKQGLVLAAIKATTDGAITTPRPEKLNGSHTLADAREALVICAHGLLQLLTSRESIGLNRTAMTSPALAEALRSAGRACTAAPIEEYLARLHELGILHIPDAAEGFRLLHGLTVQDTQIQALLGAKPPSRRARKERVGLAVDHFLNLTRTISDPVASGSGSRT